MKRHNLAPTGNGKARRFPRATAESQLARRSEGARTTTLNRHLQAAKMFIRSMASKKRNSNNPLAEMIRVANPQDDRRWEFATLTARLIAAARDRAAEFTQKHPPRWTLSEEA